MVAVESTLPIRRPRRIFKSTTVIYPWASRCEPTANKSLSRVGYLSGKGVWKHHEPIQGWRGIHQRSRVRVPWMGKQLLGWALLHHSAQVHHGNPVGQEPHRHQVVRDIQKRASPCLLNLLKQVQNLGPDRKIQCRGGFIADHQRRLRGERPSNGNPLALSAGKLMRVSIEPALVKANLVKYLAGISRNTGKFRPFHHRVANLPPWVKRGIGVLPYYADFTRNPRMGSSNVSAIQNDLARRKRLEAEDRARQRGLAAARLSHNRYDLAAMDIKGNPVKGTNHAPRSPELHTNIANSQEPIG